MEEMIMLMREKIEANRISAFTTGMKKNGKEKDSRMIKLSKYSERYYAPEYVNIQRMRLS